MNTLAAKKAQWLEWIKEQEASGLNQVDFCREKNLKWSDLEKMDTKFDKLKYSNGVFYENELRQSV